MKHEVIIVGGGVSGTALLYTLSKYSNVKNIGLIEKYSNFGLVNSASTMNSQTLHFGDIETNYKLEKARRVKRSADMVKNYLEAEKIKDDSNKLFCVVPKMVLAVGSGQVNDRKNVRGVQPALSQRRMIGKEEMKIEPRVIDDRDQAELLALVTKKDIQSISAG
jgi:malate dehydrogenase (quinone)